MKVKKYTAQTMPEAMKKIRQELGDNAVILDSKVVYLGGFLGFFKKKNFQVIAALDQQPVPRKKENTLKHREKKETSIKPPSSENEGINKNVLYELKEMKKWLEKNKNMETPAYVYPVQMLYYHLLENEMEKEYVKEWLDDLNQVTIEKEKNITKKEVAELLGTYLENKVNGYDFSGIDYKKKYIHLAGPTGVGKTTTIAKLAANSLMQDNKKVALITTDTYRIAAIDQLKTYAKILDIPLEVAYNRKDYEQAKEKFRNYDLVLIDTAGRNFRNPEYVKDFGNMMEPDMESEYYLVLSLTSKFSDQKEIYKQFQSLPIKQFIFTKVDETSSFGSMINMMLFSGKGIAYITNGQEVPDNISGISIEKINQLIVGDYAND